MQEGFQKNFLIMAPRASLAFAESLAQSMEIQSGHCEERAFADGEFTIRPIESVRGRRIIVVQSLFRDHEKSIADKLAELLFLGGALKDAGAQQIVLIAPYLCFARQDRQTAFQGPVFTRSLAELLETAGMNLIVTMDVHNLSAYQNSFRCPTLHLSAVDLFADYALRNLSRDRLSIVSPDIGGIKRCESLCRAIRQKSGSEVGLSVVMKHRVDHLESDEIFLGAIDGHDIMILDDMISTGSTLAHAVRICARQGAKRIFVAATHGLFATEAETTLQDLPIERIMITNSVVPYQLESPNFKARVEVLDSIPIFVGAMQEFMKI